MRELLVKAWGLITKAWAGYKRALPAIVALLLLALALHLAGVPPSKAKHKGLASVTEPAEFIYMDEARVRSYLSQVTGDEEAEDEKREETTTQNANAGLELPYAKAGLSNGSQLVRNIVLKRTAADRLQTLEQDAKIDKKGINAASCKEFVNKLKGLKDGELVKLENALVETPPYLSAYPELRNLRFREPTGSHIFGAVPLASFYQVDESVRGTPRKEREAFKKAVGPNPRVPFSISSATEAKETEAQKTEAKETGAKKTKAGKTKAKKTKAGETKAQKTLVKECKPAIEEPTTVVLPARFANLTGDPSLLGTPLTIVGIVVGRYEHGFGDGTSLQTYWPALSVAHAPLLRELGVRANVLKQKRIEVRKQLFNAVKRTLTFSGQVVEVVPIAMYGT